MLARSVSVCGCVEREGPPRDRCQLRDRLAHPLRGPTERRWGAERAPGDEGEHRGPAQRPRGGQAVPAEAVRTQHHR